ncbi:MAG: PD-(D/E)XK nuclease family protein [Clostridia bacterium]|nr:PD-(D/E)XK nuclease family protein [Clostridia bacterium]
MLTLIQGGFFAGGHDMIKAQISSLTANGKRSILIVPEQQTVSAERELTDALPPSAPLFFEVTNFTRFANTVFRTLGGLTGESADTAKRSLIMWRAMTELAPVLEYGSKNGSVSSGSVTKMLGTVKQLQSFAITPKDLADVADELEGNAPGDADGRLISKLRDASKIMLLYKKLLSEHFSDTDDALLLTAEKLSANKSFLSDTVIFIDGFTSFTEPQYKVLGELLLHTEVTVSLTLPKSSPDAYEFAEIKAARERLIRLASEAGCNVAQKKIDGRSGASLMISELSSLLWRNNAKIDTDAYLEPDSLHIFAAENPYEECAFVAEDIRRRVIGGAKYSDFGVIARNLDTYSGILDVAFEKAGVPLFMSKRSDIGSYEVIKLIYSAFSVISGGFARADVISYSKCSLSGVDKTLADEFELYVEKWQISGKRFTDGIFWNMNPAGYTEKRSRSADEKLALIDRAREAVISPLMLLSDALSSANTVKDYATALVEFLTALNMEAALEKRSEEERILRGSEAADDMNRLWRVICGALDSLVEVLSDTKTDPETFLSLLKITFAGTDIGRIPAFTEQVSAGSADTARMHGKKYIYIIGANAGVFPPPVDDDSYFTDKDKRTLSLAGLAIDADTDIRSARELYLFERSISFARVGINILYSETDTAFKATPPSEVISRIKDLTDGKICPVRLSDLPMRDKAYSAEYALDHLCSFGSDLPSAVQALGELGYEDILNISRMPIKNANLKLSRESLDRLYGKSIDLTQSKLESYVKCPLSYFCRYNLGLLPIERAEFDARNIGNFLHAVLENFFAELKARGVSIAEITDEEKGALILRVSTEYIKGCFEGIPETSARIRDTVNKLCRAAKPIIDGLCDEFSDCKYEPIFFELDIDKDVKGAPEPVIFTTDRDKEVYITGKIDRVDAFKSGGNVYIRVIDYKSGNKIFSPSDIERGLNLQMFLYLKSVVDTKNPEFRAKVGLGEGGKMIPAGVIYVKTAIEDAKISRNSEAEALAAVKKNQARIGMLLDDEVSIGAMNARYIPIKFKSDGTPDAYSKSKLYTETGWELLSGKIEAAIKDISKRMTEGDIAALPLIRSKGKSDVCKYCDFKAICRNASSAK